MEAMVIIGDSRNMVEVPDESVALIVTSPPTGILKTMERKARLGMARLYMNT